MTHFQRALLSLAVCLCPALASLPAVEPPQVRIAIPSAEALKQDLKFLTELNVEKKYEGQWANIQDLLDTFLPGIDQTRPIRFDQILAADGQQSRFSIPVSGRRNFGNFVKQNLQGFGINARRGAGGFFALAGGGFPGFMRFENDYAVISEEKANLPKNFVPGTDIKALLAKAYGIGATIDNDADGQKDRTAGMENLQKELLGALKKRTTESEKAFVLRKLVLSTPLDELERFFVQSSNVTIGFVTDAKKKESRAELSLTGLPGTDLDASVQLLGKTPSLFAALPRDETAILSLRINHPLDDMRQKSLVALIETAGPAYDLHTDSDEDRGDDSKTALKKASALFLKQLTASIQNTKVLDGVLDIWSNDDGDQTLVGGINSADGKTLDAVLKLFPAINTEMKFTPDVDKEGDVAIHSVNVPQRYLAKFQEFCGKHDVVYFGLSDKVVWYAAGPDALDKLKASIKTAAGEAPEVERINVIDGFLKVGPWINYLGKRRDRVNKEADAAGKKLTTEEKKAREERDEVRKLAIAAFEDGDDTISGQLYRVEEEVNGKTVHRAEGQTVFGTGILRFIGTMMSRFSKETFAD
ncbi:MAG: hypothetical protein CMJ48_04160 [Planctomycetaceae bacterium]|nr:hypothetical protein [Planctomycetaceae bacterium]